MKKLLNEEEIQNLANSLFNQTTELSTSVTTLQVMISALCVLLIEKGICTQDEFQAAIGTQMTYYNMLRKAKNN
jgi:hypothetical protein